MMKSVVVALTLSACASIALPSTAATQVAQSGYSLPLALALEAATTAINAAPSTPRTPHSLYRGDNGAHLRCRLDKRLCRDRQQKSGRR